MISYGRQTLDDDDIQAVVVALQADCITQGGITGEFETEVKNYCQANAAVALANGTLALYLCCRAMGLKQGGLLWTSPNSYVASANCAYYCNADVDFVDIDATTGNMDINLLEQKLLVAEREGRLPDIIIPVHFAGLSCDMEKIAQLSSRYGFRVIEDACHALGAEYRGKKVGGCHWSDATVFSFHPVKSITTAEGGMVVSNDESLVSKIRLLANGGVSRRAQYDPWYCEMETPGINARMSEIHAALGVSQMKKLDKFIECRTCIAEYYCQALQETGLQLPDFFENNHSAWHLFVVHENYHQKVLCRTLRRAGIGINVHYVPIHTHPWYLKQGFKQGDFPNAENHYKTAISLPLFPSISDTQINYVITTLKSLLLQAA